MRNKYHLAQCKNSCQTRLLLRVGLYLCVCTHVLLMCLFKILLFRGINETMKTHKIKVTGVENIVDIYNRNSFFFLSCSGIEFRASHMPGKPFTTELYNPSPKCNIPNGSLPRYKFHLQDALGTPARVLCWHKHKAGAQ